MSQPVIVQFESESYYIQVANMILYPFGFELKASAIGKDKAVNLLQRIGQKEIAPDIAIVETMIDASHDEGEKIAKKLREISPATKIVAYTTIKDEEIPWADAVAVKFQRDPSRTLIEALKLAGLPVEKGKTQDRS